LFLSAGTYFGRDPFDDEPDSNQENTVKDEVDPDHVPKQDNRAVERIQYEEACENDGYDTKQDHAPTLLPSLSETTHRDIDHSCDEEHNTDDERDDRPEEDRR